MYDLDRLAEDVFRDRCRSADYAVTSSRSRRTEKRQSDRGEQRRWKKSATADPRFKIVAFDSTQGRQSASDRYWAVQPTTVA